MHDDGDNDYTTRSSIPRYPPQPMDAKCSEECAFIQKRFFLGGLDGETIFRTKTRQPAKARVETNKRTGRRNYQISEWAEGRVRKLKASRIKFALAHGWLPKTVDHRDRNSLNDAIGNLRPATHREQAWNMGPRVRPKNPALPMGVHPVASGKYVAFIWHNSRRHYLGTYETPEQARAAYNAAKFDLRGPEFFVKTRKKDAAAKRGGKRKRSVKVFSKGQNGSVVKAKRKGACSEGAAR